MTNREVQTSSLASSQLVAPSETASTMSNDPSQYGWQSTMVMYPPSQQAGQSVGQPLGMMLPEGMFKSTGGTSQMGFTGMLENDLTQQQQQLAIEAMLSGKGGALDKVSHKSVEKLRRDRINMLIEELRELVPPSAGSIKLEGPESRRPKHVVLSDTITLLKNMKTTPAAAPAEKAAAPAAHAAGAHQTSSHTKSCGSTSDQDEVDGLTGAPQLPVIPMRPNAYRGVLVEKGPNCMYVQVKCRDRRGLLSDIIHALHSLPLQIRTASVTTAADGSVHDVFEVTPDSPDMPPDEVQNLVHDALFQPVIDGKRAR